MSKKEKSMSKTSRIMIVTIISLIILCTACIGGYIYVYDENGTRIATGVNALPQDYYCENHTWTAAGSYVPDGGVKNYDLSKKTDLIACYIFGSDYEKAVKQKAFWNMRSIYIGNCNKPALGDQSRSLYNQAVNYANIMMNMKLGEEGTIADAKTTKRIIQNGKYYYDFAVAYNDNLKSNTITNSDGAKSFTGNIYLGDKIGQEYYYSDKKSDNKVDIYKTKLKFSYTEEDKKNVENESKEGKIDNSYLYIKDDNGMQHSIEQNNILTAWINGVEKELKDYFLAKDNNNLMLLEKKTNSKGQEYYHRICDIQDANGKKSAEIVALYTKNSADNEEITNIGFGNHSADSGAKIFYINSVNIDAIGKDGKKISKQYTSRDDILSILKSNADDKLSFEIEVDENLYEAQSVKIVVNYEYCLYSGTYQEFKGQYSPNSHQRLMKPNVTKKWESGSIEIGSITTGNRYVNLEIDKYEGAKATGVTDNNLLTGAAFSLKKGYLEGKSVADLNKINYEDVKKAFKSETFETSKVDTQSRKEWRIDNTSKFNWEEIKLTTEDIENRKYVVFEITEEPPAGYVGVDKFYILANVIDLDSNAGYYYLSNSRIVFNEATDKDKILLKENGQTTTDSYTIKPVINVANPKKGNGNLQLLKVDSNGTAINDVKFDVTVTRYKDSKVKGKEDTFTLTTENKELAIGSFLQIPGKTDGVAETNTTLSDIDSIKFTVKEQDHNTNKKLPDYLEVIPEFSMEFGVKLDSNGYVLSNTYVSSSKDTYAKSFKYNGKVVTFDKTVNGVESYTNSDGSVSIGIKDPNTKDASIRLIIQDENNKSFNLDFTKTDTGTGKVVEGAGFDVKVTRVDKSNYSTEKGTIYKNKETLYTDKDGKIQIPELKNITLTDLDVNNEYIKVTITETKAPEVEDNAYYEMVNEGKPFSFIIEAEKDNNKIKLTNIKDTIDWPAMTDGIKGYAETPTIENNNVKINIKDNYNTPPPPEYGKYSIRILKQNLNGDIISAKNPAEFEIKVNNEIVENKNPVSGKSKTTFVAKDGQIELDYENYKDVLTLHHHNDDQTISIRETKAPDVDGDGKEDYKKINDGKWFTATAKVAQRGSIYRLSGSYEKDDTTWPKATEDNRSKASVRIVNDYVVEFTVKDESITDGRLNVELFKTNRSGQPLSGAEFKIEVKADGKTLKTETLTTTSPDGKISLENIDLKSGMKEVTVYFTETKAPDGYKLVNGGQTFYTVIPVEETDKEIRISNNKEDHDCPEAVQISVENHHTVIAKVIDDKTSRPGKYNISLHKVDSKNMSKDVPGAEFTIEVNGKRLRSSNNTYTFVTNNEGIIETDEITLTDTTPQHIKITETKAPDGFLPINDGNPIEVTLEVERDTSGAFVLKKDGSKNHVGFPLNYKEETSAGLYSALLPEPHEPEGEYDISLRKVDERNHDKVLKDAWFKITVIHGSTTEVIKNPNPVSGIDDDIFVTNSEGKITTGKIKLKLGSDGKPEDQHVILTEVKAPAGYEPINNGAPIEAVLKVKREGNKLMLDSASDHMFFPANYTEKVTEGEYYITALPESPVKYNLKLYKQFKDNDGTVRKANFEVKDVINGDEYVFNDVDTSGENSKDLVITDKNSSEIKLKVKEIKSALNNGWGVIPEFYLTIATKQNSNGSYAIDRSKPIEITPVNEADKENFDLIKNQLIKVTVSSDGTSISLVGINPLEGNININLNKFDASANNAKMKDVKFKVTMDGATIKDSSGNDYFVTNNDGIISIPNVKVTSASGKIKLGIHELKYSEGNEAIKYYKEIPDFEITLNKTLEDQVYTVSNEYETTLEKDSKVTVKIAGDSKNKLITISVPNERRIMRLSGQVWKDIPSSGKVSEVDGKKQSSESFINGITVKVHASDGSDILTKYKTIVENTSKKTDSQKVNGETKEGYYYFDVPMYDGSYYIEYVYNGYKYQHTKYTPWNGQGVNSNATETESDRDELNNRFAVINSGSVNNQINNTHEQDTSYSGVKIGISAFTGGFGRNNLVTFSARKYDNTEGKCDNKTGSNNSTKYVDGSIKDRSIDGKVYDYIYDNIDLGITPRESVYLQLAKAVNRVKFQVMKPTGEVISQTYMGKKYGQDEYEKIDENTTAYIGEIEVGVRKEDEYTRDDKAINANVAADVHTYITYRLHLTNNSSDIGVQFNDIVDYYDSSLVLQSVILANEDGSKKSDISNATRDGNKSLQIYESNGNNSGTTKNNFKELHITPNLKVEPGATYYIDVTFEMPTIPENIIQNSDSDSVKESKLKTNVAEVNSYTTYYIDNGLNAGNNYSYNEHKANDIAGIFDLESNPGNVIGLKKTGIATRPYLAYPHEKDDGIAFAKFIEKEERELSGKVWKDDRNNEVEKAVIGDGEHQTDEEGYEGVTVQLFDNDTGNIAKVYYSGDNKWDDAITRTTDTNGNYAPFTGIAPGNYYILFTYPDGQTYKSTIFADAGQSSFDVNNPDVITSAVFNLDADDNKSHARDKYGDISTPKTRQYVNNLLASNGEINSNTGAKDIKENYDEYITANLNNEIAMEAISSMLNVGFETDKNNTDPNIKTTYYDSLNHWGGITWEYVRKNKVTNINLGVVVRPVNQLQISKKVSNVKLILANGSTLFDASGRATNVQWINPNPFAPIYSDNKLNAIDNNIPDPITGIPNWRSGVKSGNINLTMDEELMQGATIKIKYKITVTNIGEVDYNDKEFYYKGVENNREGNIVETTVNEIVDYVGYQSTDDGHATRNNLNFVAEDNNGLGWNYKTADELKDDGKLSEKAAYGESYNPTDPTSLKAGADTYSTIIVNGSLDNSTLKPKLFYDNEDDVVKAEKDLTLSKMISSSSGTDDLTYNNMVEIIKLTNDVGRRTQYSTVGNQDPTKGPMEVDTDEAQEVAIGEPYGQTQIPYLLYSGIATILILGVVSIIIIRKKTSKE